MDSRFLESFVMVIDNGSIAEAARRLNITAAGVAQRIRSLETDIGARLPGAVWSARKADRGRYRDP